MEFAGRSIDSTLVALVDTNSKWLEVIPLRTNTSTHEELGTPSARKRIPVQPEGGRHWSLLETEKLLKISLKTDKPS